MATIRLYKEELRDPDTLPAVCIKCGAAADLVVRKSFAWMPPWVLITLLGPLPLFVILVVIFRKTGRIHAPMCTAHAWHWRSRSITTWTGFVLLLLVGIAFMAIGASLGPRQANDYGILLFIAWFGLLLLLLIVAAVVQTTAIRPSEITDKWITLVRVSPQFRDAVEAASAAAARPEGLPVVDRPAAPLRAALPGTDAKLCPYCAETIKATAVKCRFCGEFLEEE